VLILLGACFYLLASNQVREVRVHMILQYSTCFSFASCLYDLCATVVA